MAERIGRITPVCLFCDAPGEIHATDCPVYAMMLEESLREWRRECDKLRRRSAE
jgi:hypothetical protein